MADSTSQTPSKKSNNKIVYLVMILLLVGLNVFMYITKVKTEDANKNILSEKAKVDSAKTQLERDYVHALAEIEQYKGQNAALDSLLYVKIDALNAKKNEINKILIRQNIDKEDLSKALRLIGELKIANNNYIRVIDSFKVANQIISKKLDKVEESLVTTVKINDDLKVENSTLQRLGSILRIMNVHIIGEVDKGKGKEKETTNVKRLNYLKIQFDVDQNRVAEPGDKTIYYKITCPDNSIMYDSNKGSGTLSLSENNVEVKYTGKATFNYDGRAKKIATQWTPKVKLLKGEYKVEYYFDGYLIATSTFNLTSSIF
jgi:hypothetical protein